MEPTPDCESFVFPHPLGCTREQFVAAAAKLPRAIRPTPHNALLAYRALFREGVIPSFAPFEVHPVVRESRETLEDREGHGPIETVKFVLRHDDGLETESVIIPMIRGDRVTTTLCVSSQIGCAMGCTFCETAQMGLMKSLTAEQIVMQWWVSTYRVGVRPKNIVFMGMGEPTDNLDAVLAAVEIFASHDGGHVPATNITISTVGNPLGIARIGELVDRHGFHKLNLAVSLNAPNDSVRNQIMPVNRAWNMAILRDAIVAFPKYGRGAMCIEYVLIPGVNDAPEHCDEVCAYLKGIRCSLNVIPYNPRRNSPWPAPTEESVLAFMARAIEQGQFTKRRGTKGRSQMAACGQLGNEEIRKRKFVGLAIEGTAARSAEA
ncbi:MAG: 23S rRNA (adenine(2503)-C(2))-methyltransferase RlmN [Phycisphaerales bacterium]|nr:23S rRNA (adenine(2503)-C(2))-methyltransferase RlmN [Phycisphaerales bacterium]